MTEQPERATQGTSGRGQLVRTLVGLLPGLALTAAVAVLGLWSSEWIGKDLLGFPKSPISGVMMAIVLGLLLGNLLRIPRWFRPGVQFSLKKILRLGIILLGIRLSVGDVVKLGAMGIPVILVCIAGGLLVTSWLGKRLKVSERLSTLIAVGTSICGASAIVAAGPAIDAKEEEVTYAVANITVFGILAMFLYPHLAHALFGQAPTSAGLFLGTAIHETAQVAGAGMIYRQLFDAARALDAATVAKLVRNVFMALVIPFMAYVHRRRSESKEVQGKVSVAGLFPTFILGFLLLAVARSIGDATAQSSGLAFWVLDGASWGSLTKGLETWAGNFLAMAMAGVGLGTSVKQLKGLGLRPFYAGLGAAVSVGALSLLGITCLGWVGF